MTRVIFLSNDVFTAKMEYTDGTKSEYVALVGENYALLNRCFTTTNFVKLEGVVLKEGYCQYLDKIRQMDVRNDDTWLVTFPKSGVVSNTTDRRVPITFQKSVMSI